MPPRAGFGQSNDYSALFSSLYQADIANRERLDAQSEARTKEAQAAKDADEFSKFQNGDIGGAELLAYIRTRVAATAGDPTENEKWKDALRQYGASIADQAAEDAFANGGSANDLVAYYRGRMSTLAKGSPEYSSIQKRLDQVIDDAQSHDLFLGAQRIQDKIDRGEATLEDLQKFLKNQLSSLRPGSTNRDQLLQQINTVQDNIHTRDVTASIGALDYKLAAGQISAADYNTQILKIAAPYQASDPSTYYGLLTKGQNAIDNEAQTAFNPTLPWNGVTSPAVPTGTTPSTPRAPGGTSRWVPGVPDSGAGNDIKYVSQFDGSTFAKVNCVYASGAMLAQAMGVSDLSGGDLRWLSGDTQGGSTYRQLMHALGKVGLSADYSQNISFNDFLNKIKSGTPATLGGLDARLPDNLHGAYQGKHSIYVDSYDPQKGFLVYDPATGKPRYWSEAILRAFSWGGANMPNALFAPASAVTPNRTPPANVSIFDQPKRPETPRNYGTGNSPGTADTVRTTLAQTNTNPAPRTTPTGDPIPYGQSIPTTKDEASNDLAAIAAMQDRALAMSDAFNQGSPTYVDGTPLNEQVVHDALNEAYGAAAWRSYLASGSDNPQADMTKALAASQQLGNKMLDLGDTRQNEIFNNLIAKTDAIFAHSDANSADPFQSTATIQTALATLRTFADGLDAGQPTGNEAVTGTFKDQVEAVVKATELAADPKADPTDVAVAIAALPSNYRGIPSGVQGATQAAAGVADGTRVITVVPDSQGKPQFTTAPARQETLPDGSTANVPIFPNVSRLQMAPVTILVGGKPTVIFVPSQPQDVPGLTQMTVTNYALVNSYLSKGTPGTLTPPLLTAADNGQPLTQAQLTALGDTAIRGLMVNGLGLTEAPIQLPSVTVPAYLSNGVSVPSRTYYQDLATGLWTPDGVQMINQLPDKYGGITDYVPNPTQSWFSVIDATGAKNTMQDFVNNGGIDAYDTGLRRDAQGNAPNSAGYDSTTAYVPDKSQLYSTDLPSAYMQSQAYRDFRAGERGDTAAAYDPTHTYPAGTTLGPPAPNAPVPTSSVNPYTGFVTPNLAMAGLALTPLVNTASSLGINLGKQISTLAKPGFVPPQPTPVSPTGFNPAATGYVAPTPPKITIAAGPTVTPAVNSPTGFNPLATGYVAPAVLAKPNQPYIPPAAPRVVVPPKSLPNVL